MLADKNIEYIVKKTKQSLHRKNTITELKNSLGFNSWLDLADIWVNKPKESSFEISQSEEQKGKNEK